MHFVRHKVDKTISRSLISVLDACMMMIILLAITTKLITCVTTMTYCRCEL